METVYAPMKPYTRRDLEQLCETAKRITGEDFILIVSKPYATARPRYAVANSIPHGYSAERPDEWIRDRDYGNLRYWRNVVESRIAVHLARKELAQ